MGKFIKKNWYWILLILIFLGSRKKNTDSSGGAETLKT